MGELIKLKEIIGNMFEEHGVSLVDRDWLMAEVLNMKRSELMVDKSLTVKEIRKIYTLAKKRCKGMPLSQVLKKVNFYGYDFIVDKHVLSPRPETELLVEEIIKTKGIKHGLDVGTGSGAIAITLQKEAEMCMTAVDVSAKALKVAKKNAAQLASNVQFIKSDLFNNIKGKKFDFIVSNPPYIRTEDLPFLDKEVKNYEPRLALDGGKTGLDYYEKIIAEAPKYLVEGGYIFFEVGIGEAKSVEQMLEKDFCDITIIKDYEKIERIIKAKKKL